MHDINSYHESGHMVMALLLGARVAQATIEPEQDDGLQRHADVRVLWPRANLVATFFVSCLAPISRGTLRRP
jgi:hypothetical protein